jgi:hypothetical protein
MKLIPQYSQSILIGRNERIERIAIKKRNDELIKNALIAELN